MARALERIAVFLLASMWALQAPGAGGHVKLLGGVVDTDATRRPMAGWDLRLFQEGGRGSWRGRVALQSLGLRLAGAPPLLLPDDGRRFLDLTASQRSGAWWRTLRLDRLWLEHAGPRWRWRLGRQAVSWGQGLVFNPLDVFDPFPPAAIDTEYKPGEDALYAQRTLAGGADVQMLAVARASPDAASYAVKWHWAGASLDLDLLAARHWGETLLAAGLALPVGGAMLRGDLLHWSLAAGDAWEGVVNMDYALTWRARPLYLFAEYYHQGLPAPALAVRLTRGERFVPGRDHFAAGMDLQFHPLWHLEVGALADGGGTGALGSLALTWDVAEDWQWESGALLPVGAGPWGSAPRWLYTRLLRYF